MANNFRLYALIFLVNLLAACGQNDASETVVLITETAVPPTTFSPTTTPTQTPVATATTMPTETPTQTPSVQGDFEFLYQFYQLILSTYLASML